VNSTSLFAQYRKLRKLTNPAATIRTPSLLSGRLRHAISPATMYGTVIQYASAACSPGCGISAFALARPNSVTPASAPAAASTTTVHRPGTAPVQRSTATDDAGVPMGASDLAKPMCRRSRRRT
jgi:hypothetical protein